VTKIDAFAHILRPACAERLEAITSAGAVSGQILGYGPLNLIIFADTIADISSLGLPDADEAAIFAGNARRRHGIAA